MRFVVLILLFTTHQVSTSYLSHVQNYVNLVSAYYLDGHSTKDFPPLQNVTHPMVVRLSMSLYAINGFDEVAGNIEIVSVLRISWTDEMPTIQSINFQKSDRDSFLVPYDMIWTPKLVLTNAIGDASEVGDSAYLCRFNMTSNMVTWSPRVVISAACTPDVTYYPFDKQTCSFEYTSWGFESNEVMLEASSNEWDQSSYGESGEWDISTTETETYINDNQSFIKFKLSIIRKPLYFAFNILLPVLVLCLLNSTVFLLPAESGERVGFSVTCFLAFVVLLNMIMDIMPRSSSPISFLCYYLVVMMANSGAMTLFTILLMRVYYKPEKSVVPRWLQRTVTFINCRCAKLRCCVLCCRFIRYECQSVNKRLCGCGRQKRRATGEMDLIDVKQRSDTTNETSLWKYISSCFACFATLTNRSRPLDEQQAVKSENKDVETGHANILKRIKNALPCFGRRKDHENPQGEVRTSIVSKSTHGCNNPLSKCFICFGRQQVEKLSESDIESQLIATNRLAGVNKDSSERNTKASEKVLERWEDKRANLDEKKGNLKDVTTNGKGQKTAWMENIDEHPNDKGINVDETTEKDEKIPRNNLKPVATPKVDVTTKSGNETSKMKETTVEPEVVTDDSDDDEDSLADLEEEVKWPEVGRILDTFFFLTFLGGQAFFTVIFLVPLFTAP